MNLEMGRPNQILMKYHIKRVGLEARKWQEKEAAGAEEKSVPSVSIK